MELGAGNVLLRLAEHGADMDMPRVTFDTDVDANPTWTPLSLRTLTQRAAARAEWFARHGIGRRDPVAVSLPGSRFNDTLGSTEMGYGGFGISHRPGTERYGRCVGKPQPFAEIILVDQQTGQEVPVGEVGMVAMSSPTFLMRQRLLASTSAS
jgi:acyl-CoA synthetase (AMP-forming)/AMP-acid ligase II